MVVWEIVSWWHDSPADVALGPRDWNGQEGLAVLQQARTAAAARLGGAAGCPCPSPALAALCSWNALGTCLVCSWKHSWKLPSLIKCKPWRQLPAGKLVKKTGGWYQLKTSSLTNRVYSDSINVQILIRKQDWNAGFLRCEFNGFSLIDEDSKYSSV